MTDNTTLEHVQILVKNITGVQLIQQLKDIGIRILIDRGFEDAVEWLLEIGCEVLHTVKRNSKFCFVYDVPPNRAKGRRIIPTHGDPGFYSAQRKLKTKSGKTITVYGYAVRSGTGKVRFQSTLPTVAGGATAII